jgi:hypothetical protein
MTKSFFLIIACLLSTGICFAQTKDKHSYIARPEYSLVQDSLNGSSTLDDLKAKIGC